MPLQAVSYEGRLLINPGSATGAYSNVIEDVKPSFVLMDIDGSKVRLLWPSITCEHGCSRAVQSTAASALSASLTRHVSEQR